MESTWVALALARGKDIEKLQRKIHSQRVHIRKLRERLYSYHNQEMYVADVIHATVALKDQVSKLLNTVATLKSRNSDLEALHHFSNPDIPMGHS